jgi:hypothetical protein
MDSIQNLLARLSGVRRSGNGWQARCPAHDDKKPSLSIGQGSDGRALLCCHAGCDVTSILAALGLGIKDLFPPRDSDATPKNSGSKATAGRVYPSADAALAVLERRFGRSAASWAYRDAQGQNIGIVARWNQPDSTKKILPISLHADGWRVKAMPTPRVLYGLPELLEADPATPVCVCEGELCADAARKLGFIATTSSGGAGAASLTDWAPLSGKTVWILPDNDPAGRKYAKDVAGILAHLPTPPREIRIVELPGLPDAGDIVDWVTSHGDSAEPEALRQEIESLAQEAELWQPDDMNAPNGADGSSEGVQDLEYRPFPVQALPGPVRDFVDAGARAIGCDPSFLALPLLAALASAVGNTRRLELKPSWRVPVNIWVGVVGESGTAKSPAIRAVTKPVYERQRRALERHAEAMRRYKEERARFEHNAAVWKKSGAGLPPVEPEEPQAERYVVSDTTLEAVIPLLVSNPRGLLLARDELSAWLAGFDKYTNRNRVSSELPAWLSMYDGAPIVVDRKTGQRTAYVPRASVCILGGVQPAILRRALGPEHRESGLAARLLLAYPPRKARQWTEASIDPAVEAKLEQLFDRLYDLQPATSEDGDPQPVIWLIPKKVQHVGVDTQLTFRV